MPTDPSRSAWSDERLADRFTDLDRRLAEACRRLDRLHERIDDHAANQREREEDRARERARARLEVLAIVVAGLTPIIAVLISIAAGILHLGH